MTLLDAVTKVPQIGPPRQSLFAIATVDNENDDRFIGGLQWDPEPLRTEGGGDLGTWKVDASNTAVSGHAVTPYATGNAFGIWASEVKTGITVDFEDMKARVTRKLLAYESRAAEAQLWSDSLGVNPSLKLANSTAQDAGAGAGQSITRSIGIADRTIADQWGRGMLHMRPETLAGAVNAQVLTKEGNVWLTPLGNIVIPGAGYSGLSPAGSGSVGDDYIFMTPPVEVHRSGVVITPNNVVEATDRSVNNVIVYAIRFVAILWDYSAGSYYVRATY